MQNRTLLLLCSLVIIFFYLCDSQATDYFSTLTPACTVLPRVRRAWTDLTQAQQTTYVKTVVQMKALTGAWKAGSTAKSSLYNFFVTIHAESYNSYVWHGTSFFLPAHKWFMWNYESALIYVAYQKYATIGIAQTDACKLAVPYWDWTLDYDPNTNDNICPFPSTSPLLDAADIGSKTVASRTKYVQDGVFDTLSAWTMVYAVQSSVTDYRLKRIFDCKNYPLTIGPMQAIQAISTYRNFADFTSWLEGYPHGIPHMNIGMSMGGMGSPDDPIFFLHHSNVDRLYHVWVDCNEYENIPANSITTAQYTGQGTAYNPYTNVQYDVSVDATIPYSFGYSSGIVDSVIFPKSTWPTPRIMWPTITGGYKGFNLRYGPDYLVKNYGSMCTYNVQWSIVNYASSKRDVEGDDDTTTTFEQDPQVKENNDRFDAGINAGRPHHEVMRELAENECRNSPKLQVTDELKQWIKMNNLKIEQFDTVCNKVSESFSEGGSGQKPDSINELQDGSRAVPLWVIITASVGTALVLVAIVTLIILYFRKKNSPTVIDNSYVEMK